MILDRELDLSISQAITATGVTRGTDYVSLKALKDIAPGADLNLYALVAEAFNLCTSLQVQVVGGSAETAGAPNWSDEVVLADSGAVALAALTLGKPIPMPQVMQGKGTYKYLGLKFTVVGTAPTTGKLKVGFLPYPLEKPANAGVTL